MSFKSYPNMDGHWSADVIFDDVTVEQNAVIGQVDNGYSLLEFAIDVGLAGLCAEAVGAMTKLFEFTLEYVCTRKQFGQPIGRFQAIQHRCTEMLAAIEQSRSATLMATANINASDICERRRAVSAAKLLVSRNGRWISEQAVQLHGAVAMTEELAVGRYVKRLNCIAATWGDTDQHTELLGLALQENTH